MTEKISPEMVIAIERTLYNHPFGGKAILELLTGRRYPNPLPAPTGEEENMAHATVEDLLRIHYTALNESMKENLGEELEDNPYVKK